MGQKVHPIGFRVGIFEDWFSSWYSKKDYGKTLAQDLRIRAFLDSRLNRIDVEKVRIERTGSSIKLIIWSSKPGLVIGRKGQGIEQLREDLFRKFDRSFEVAINEVKTPDISGQLVALSIADQIERRVNFKRAMKKAGFASVKAGAKGVKICCSGRLGGAEIARPEWFRFGSVPLHTLRAKISYGFAEATTTYGKIGVKVWICNGMY